MFFFGYQAVDAAMDAIKNELYKNKVFLMQVSTAHHLPILILCSASRPEASFLVPSHLAHSPVPYLVVMLFKPGAGVFATRCEVLVINDNGSEPNVGFFGGCFMRHHGSYSGANQFNRYWRENSTCTIWITI
jgi:hypothetical protein